MKREGFTFLEIVVSMLIFGIVVAGTMGLFITANKHIVNQRHRSQAYNQALKVLEQLRYYVSADPNNPTHAGEAFNDGGHSTSLIGLGGTPDMSGVNNPQWSYSVTDVTGSNCKEVTVTVSWEEV